MGPLADPLVDGLRRLRGGLAGQGLNQQQLRELLGETSSLFPCPRDHEHLSFISVNPHLGFLEWHVRQESVKRLREGRELGVAGMRPVIRVYDVTDVLFDGGNAHATFDVPLLNWTGSHYLNVERSERNLLAELGLVVATGEFHPLLRSSTFFLDRAVPSTKVDRRGLFVGRRRGRHCAFAVDDVSDASAYERLDRALEATAEEPLSLAVALVRLNEEMGARLLPLMDAIGQRCRDFGGEAHFFSNDATESSATDSASLVPRVDALAKRLTARLLEAHRRRPFQVLHCHDWYTARVGLEAQRVLGIPYVLTLHSTERERASGRLSSPLSLEIAAREREAVEHASRIIVPHERALSEVVAEYGVARENVQILPLPGLWAKPFGAGPDDLKRSLQLHPDWPLVLFAGEMAEDEGADILLEAILTLVTRAPEPQFVLAGEGPLRAELEGRVWAAGIAHRVRFLGDVSSERFAELLSAADSVVIPARSRKHPALVDQALALGKPVVVTHQAQLSSVHHGRNGFVVYDNPGSLVWGLEQLICSAGKAGKRSALPYIPGRLSLDRVVVEHYVAYLSARRGVGE